MARGWESKSVEDQISERESEVQHPRGEKLTTEEKERHARLGSLRLARTYAATAQEASRNERYRALLQQNLDHLDAQIAELEKAPSLLPT